jgi:hypothetical protein
LINNIVAKTAIPLSRLEEETIMLPILKVIRYLSQQYWQRDFCDREKETFRSQLDSVLTHAPLTFYRFILTFTPLVD